MNKILNRATCERVFEYKYHDIPAGLASTRASLVRLLRASDLVGWTTHEESGRLDRKALTRFATGSTTVFKHRQMKEAERSAVSILVDCSGSMSYDNGARIDTAESVTIQLSRILQTAGVSFAVTGFNGGSDSIHTSESGANSKAEIVHTERLNWIPFKTWGESLRKASPKLGSMRYWIGASTPDVSALTAAIEDIVKRPESRKIIFLITDAEGYKPLEMKALESIANNQKVTLITIGIRNDEIKKVFKNAENVNDISKLASASFNTLLRTIKG